MPCSGVALWFFDSFLRPFLPCLLVKVGMSLCSKVEKYVKVEFTGFKEEARKFRKSSESSGPSEVHGLLFLKLQMQTQICWEKKPPPDLGDLYCCLTWIHPGLDRAWGFFSTYSQVVYRSGFKNVDGGTLQRQIFWERKNVSLRAVV